MKNKIKYKPNIMEKILNQSCWNQLSSNYTELLVRLEFVYQKKKTNKNKLLNKDDVKKQLDYLTEQFENLSDDIKKMNLMLDDNNAKLGSIKVKNNSLLFGLKPLKCDV